MAAKPAGSIRATHQKAIYVKREVEEEGCKHCDEIDEVIDESDETRDLIDEGSSTPPTKRKPALQTSTKSKATPTLNERERARRLASIFESINQSNLIAPKRLDAPNTRVEILEGLADKINDLSCEVAAKQAKLQQYTELLASLESRKHMLAMTLTDLGIQCVE